MLEPEPKEPPQEAITAAIHEARRGRSLAACDKSSRGAAAFSRVLGVYAVGHNAQPNPMVCRRTPTCRKECGRACVHAEAAAIMAALPLWPEPHRALITLEMVHVKLGPGGELVGGGGPSCEQCSKLILHVGLGAMWLYESTPEEWCPHVDLARTACIYCQGEACRACDGDAAPANVRQPSARLCDHDVLDRHHRLPTVAARWRRYTAEEFHAATLRNLGMGRS